MKAAAVLATLPLAMAAPGPVRRAPILPARSGEPIENKWIVKLKPETSSMSAVSMIAADADKTFKKLNGFVASLSEKELDDLSLLDEVEFIEQDAKVWAFGTQNNAPWGLARLSNEEPGATTYTYDDTAGEGTCAYVVDTGIEVDHPEFEGRATFAYNAAGDGNEEDGNGHGTHCAGTIGSKTYGVAKKTQLYAVKVLGSDGSGTNSGIIDGMEWVVDNAPKQDCPNGVVVNMSLGGTKSQAVNQAAASIVDAGLFLAVAAGNGDQLGNPQDAAGFSPASEESACTVGASDEQDQVAEFSNYGEVVDIFAPGVEIESTYIGGKTETLDGTSMASPHIAGLGAYFLGTGAATPENLCSYIAENALQGSLSGVKNGTVNLLAQNGEA